VSRGRKSQAEEFGPLPFPQILVAARRIIAVILAKPVSSRHAPLDAIEMFRVPSRSDFLGERRTT